MPKPLPDNQAAHWGSEIERAKKRYRTFWSDGDTVVDQYRLQKADGNAVEARDKYNILYSSTETIRPNLYAQQPKPRVVLRSKDTANDVARAASLLLEGNLKYLLDEEDFDELMKNVVEDYLLPGLGTAWVRYEARFQDKIGDDKKPVLDARGQPEQTLLDEMVKMEYVYWQDILFGMARTWKEVPWAARRLWKTKEEATELWGATKANKLKYMTRASNRDNEDNKSDTAEVWEIWNKANRKVYWYADGCDSLLDEKPDFLKFKKFFPCPKPLRAISNTRTMVPRSLFAQYKSQADTLNSMTKRIRLLTEALKVVGLYDGSNSKLSDVLSATGGNRMIAVENWAMFAQAGGIVDSVQWVPIDKVVQVLNELLKAREICKQEIYEITGFSDIVRGVSKASETLGAQNLKADWAGARVKEMQKEVQRFAKDVIALAGEAIAEHCAPETIALFSGIQMPEPETVKTNPEAQAQIQLFFKSCEFIKSETRRVSAVDIETDSTLLADDTMERQERSQFLAAAGAFLQQSVPAMEATPELGPLLGALLMFTVRTFPSSRPVEDEFEKVVQAMASRKPDDDKGGEKAKAAAEQQRVQAESALAQAELQQKQQADTAEQQLAAQKEQNRHGEELAKLELEAREVGIKERQLALEERELALREREVTATNRREDFKATHEAGMREEEHEAGRQDAAAGEARADEDAERESVEAEADRDQEYERMDRDTDRADADRDAAQETAKAAQKAKEAPSGG